MKETPSSSGKRRLLIWHWLKFNMVSLIGVGVQLGVLWLLHRFTRLPLALVTALAVETAILHNFSWHEWWTWADRTRRDRSGAWRRLLRFNLSTGLTSLLGNIVIMEVLVKAAAVPLLLANLIAIAACYVLNFILCEWFAFRKSESPRTSR